MAAALLVVLAGGALVGIVLGRSATGAASAAYYGYCPGGSASAVYYTYCPPARIPAHFKAYEVDQATPIQADELVLLTDQFGSETVRVSSVRLLLTPVEKRRQGRPPEPIQRADEHQDCYAVSGGVNQNRTVRVSNQFVTGAALRVGAPARLCAPASKSLTGPPAAPPSDTQHYKCYGVIEPVSRPEEVVELRDQFGSERVGVRAAQLLCAPATKKRANRPAEPAPRPDEYLVCYGVRRIQKFTAVGVFTRDQFITQRVRVKATAMLCVPSEKLP